MGESVGSTVSLPIYEAPDDYEPGEEDVDLGYVLLISNNEFPLGKWPPVPAELDADFEGLKTFLSHDFIGKIPHENLIALKNPTTTEVLSVLDDLRRKIPKDGFLAIYFATHIITINAANKEFPNETAYFAFRNSIWAPRKHVETMDTCIPLTTMAEYVNTIPCREKTFLINFALAPPQRKTLFTAAKLVYPPDDFAARLSNECRCPVLTSCANGFAATYYAKAHPECLYDPIFVRRRLYRTTVSSPTISPGKPKPAKKAAIASHGSSDSEESKDDPSGQVKSTRSRPSSAQPQSSSAVSFTPPKNAAAILPTAMSSVNDTITLAPPVKLSQLFASEKWQRFLRDWEVPPEKPIKISARPEKPGPRWESQGIGSTAVLKVDIPTDAEVTSYQRRLLYWRTKRTLAKPVNFCRVTYRYRKKVTLHAPRENSLVFNGHTIFAKAIMDTIRTGAACITSEDSVRLDTFFACVYGEMKKQVQAMREKQALDEEFEKQRVAAAIAAAIAGEEGGGGGGGGGDANASAAAAADDADSVTRKKKAGKNNDAKKSKAADNKKKKKEKKGGKKGSAKDSDAAAAEIIAQTPALFLPTIGVLPPDSRYGPSAFTQMLTAMQKQWTTVQRRLVTLMNRTRSSTAAAATRRHTLSALPNLSNKKPVYLTPALADPYLNHRLYFRCGPPPAPERPFITFVTPHTVSLTWYNPPFDGIAPLYYRLQMENVSRNFHEWQYLRMPGGPSEAVLYLAALDGLRHFEDEEEDRRRGLQQGYAYYCIRETSYIVRDLPSGIACRFRVQAYNPAGWSAFSMPSDYATPGEEQTPLPSHMIWRRLAQSGCLGILDRLKRHPHHADEQREGMRRLAAFGNNNHGFVKTAVALTIAQHCVDNLRRFADDPEVLQHTIQTMIWTLIGGKYERKVRYYYTQNPLPLSIEEILFMKEIRKRRSSIADAVTKAAADAADLAATAVANAAASGEQLRYQEMRRQQARGNNQQAAADGSGGGSSGPEEIQMQSLIGILTLLWQRWRHHSGFVNAMQGLRGAGGMHRYLGAVGLVRTHEMYQPVVNFPPPESEKDGDDWSDDDDEDDEAEKAALDEMMRERQAALQSKEKAEQQERAAKEAGAGAAAATAAAAAAAATVKTATNAKVASKKKGQNVSIATDAKAR